MFRRQNGTVRTWLSLAAVYVSKSHGFSRPSEDELKEAESPGFCRQNNETQFHTQVQRPALRSAIMAFDRSSPGALCIASTPFSFLQSGVGGRCNDRIKTYVTSLVTLCMPDIHCIHEFALGPVYSFMNCLFYVLSLFV